jgi:hypothetical protein
MQIRMIRIIHISEKEARSISKYPPFFTSSAPAHFLPVPRKRASNLTWQKGRARLSIAIGDLGPAWAERGVFTVRS